MRSRFYMPREFYIPKKSLKIADKQSDAVCYLCTIDNAKGRYWTVAGFGGKRAKPDFHFRYNTEAKAFDAIKRHFEAAKARTTRAAERRAERQQPNKLQVGTVLTGSWGYDQTNIEAYVVTNIISATMVEIARCGLISTDATGDMSDKVIPDLDNVSTTTERRRVTYGDSVKCRYCTLRPWNGRPMHRSWYA